MTTYFQQHTSNDATRMASTRSRSRSCRSGVATILFSMAALTQSTTTFAFSPSLSNAKQPSSSATALFVGWRMLPQKSVVPRPPSVPPPMYLFKSRDTPRPLLDRLTEPVTQVASADAPPAALVGVVATFWAGTWGEQEMPVALVLGLLTAYLALTPGPVGDVLRGTGTFGLALVSSAVDTASTDESEEEGVAAASPEVEPTIGDNETDMPLVVEMAESSTQSEETAVDTGDEVVLAMESEEMVQSEISSNDTEVSLDDTTVVSETNEEAETAEVERKEELAVV